MDRFFLHELCLKNKSNIKTGFIIFCAGNVETPMCQLRFIQYLTLLYIGNNENIYYLFKLRKCEIKLFLQWIEHTYYAMKVKTTERNEMKL